MILDDQHAHLGVSRIRVGEELRVGQLALAPILKRNSRFTDPVSCWHYVAATVKPILNYCREMMPGNELLVPSHAVRTLVLGAAGQLGSELVKLVPGAVGLTHDHLSVADADEVDRAFREHRPEVVFNCAAFNAVDRAESEPRLAHEVNSAGAAIAGAACRKHGAQLVHFSTNFVFDGSLGRDYLETDAARPLSVYGKSKLDGEEAVLAVLPEALVIRTAAVFGDRGSAVKGGSFPERIVERARGGERLRVVSDQRINPTYARDLAQAAIALTTGGMSGLVHVVAGGCCGWDELARAALAECGVIAEVEAVTTAELGLPAPRPLNGCLGSVRTAALRPWREGLAAWAANRAEVGPDGA
jgi:dTDP-4-dehydrorhamnose reductase